jgi:hypothetical protein
VARGSVIPICDRFKWLDTSILSAVKTSKTMLTVAEQRVYGANLYPSIYGNARGLAGQFAQHGGDAAYRCARALTSSADRRLLSLCPHTGNAVVVKLNVNEVGIAADGAVLNILLFRSCCEVDRDDNRLAAAITEVRCLVFPAQDWVPPKVPRVPGSTALSIDKVLATGAVEPVRLVLDVKFGRRRMRCVLSDLPTARACV